MRYLPLGSPLRDEMFRQWAEDCFREIELASIASAELDASLETSTAALETSVAALQALPACFSVHKNGVAQTGLVSGAGTQLTFGTEIYDVGGFFDTSTGAWTPPAGKVSMSAATIMDGTSAYAGTYSWIAIFKNGGIHKIVYSGVAADNYGMVSISIDDIANGTDAYTVFATMVVTVGTASARGAAHETWFMGHWISA